MNCIFFLDFTDVPSPRHFCRNLNNTNDENNLEPDEL